MHYRELGFDIHYLHRADRTGYKAGALDAGLRTATGEFVLIFDADFVAPPDILEKTLGHFTDPKVGMVQARWGHINRDYSLLTEVQSIMLDGHFIMEHGARSRAGRFFNFNGTAGVWRRAVIADAGGWQHDTLTEDLDLSYRAQLRGWRFVYLPDLVAPAELPVEMNAFKTQQQRWAKGSVQVCKKLLPRVLASPLPWREKVEATFHLTANLAYPLMVLLAGLMFPAMIMRYNMGFAEMIVVDVPIFLAATASVCAFYADLAEGAVPDHLEVEDQVHPGRPRDRDRAQHQQRARGDRRPLRQALRVHPHPEVPDRGRGRRLEAEGLQGQGELGALRGARPRRLLHLHVALRGGLRPRGHAALHRALPLGLPLHLGHVARPAVRVAHPAASRKPSTARVSRFSAARERRVDLVLPFWKAPMKAGTPAPRPDPLGRL